jgi:trk system potassium uptake protein TrkA
MYVIVVGGGKVGFYLAKTLLAEGHEVVVIEHNPAKAATLAQALNTVVLQGNGAEAALMEQAGMNRADVVVAVTGEDEDNLVVCQMAKRRFNVPRAIARINNPKNEAIFKKLGIDATVNSTDIIMAQIEQAIPSRSLIHLLTLRSAGVSIVELKLTASSPALGRPIKELGIPGDSILALVLRNSQAIVPSGNTVLREGDEVIAVTSLQSEQTLHRLLTGAEVP